MSIDKGGIYWNIKQEDTEDELSIFAGHTRFVNAKRNPESTNTSPPHSIRLEPSPPLYTISSSEQVPSNETRSLDMPPPGPISIPSDLPPPPIASASSSSNWGPSMPLRSSDQYIPSPTSSRPHPYSSGEQGYRHLPSAGVPHSAYGWPIGSSQQSPSASMPYHHPINPGSYPRPGPQESLERHQQYHVHATPMDSAEIHPSSAHAHYSTQYPPQLRHPIPPLTSQRQPLRQSSSQPGLYAMYATGGTPDYRVQGEGPTAMDLANLGLASRDSRLDERWSSFMADSGLLSDFRGQ